MKKNDHTAAKELPTAEFVTYYYVDEEYHTNHPMLIHRHPNFCEITYVCKGSYIYKVGSRAYELKPGNTVICNADVLHGEFLFRNEGVISCTCAINNFQVPGLPPNSLIDKVQRPVLVFEPGSAMEKLMLALYELQENREKNRDICNLLSNTIMRVVYSKLLERQENPDETNQKNDELVRNISKYLDKHYMESINLKELGETFHLSHYYLAHIFKEETGLSPMKYVMQRKIGEAQNMLMNTSLSVQEIGEQLGFSSSCHMSSVFKKYVGIPPMAYRQHFHK